MVLQRCVRLKSQLSHQCCITILSKIILKVTAYRPGRKNPGEMSLVLEEEMFTAFYDKLFSLYRFGEC